MKYKQFHRDKIIITCLYPTRIQLLIKTNKISPISIYILIIRETIKSDEWNTEEYIINTLEN